MIGLPALPCTLLLLAAPFQGQAPAIVYRVPDHPVLVPFRVLGNHVRIEATVNGSGPFELVLDTGMPTPQLMLFRSQRVDALGLADAGQRVALTGAGGSGEVREAVLASGATVGLGELEMSALPVLVLPDHAGLPPQLDGIIGAALFDRFVVRLDMDHGRLELMEPAGWTPAPGACVLPMRRVPGAAFVEVRVAVDAGEPIPAEVVLDLGASHAISFNARADGTLAPPARAIEAALGRGLSGVVRGDVGRLRRLELGPFVFEDVVASFPVAEHRHPGGFDFRDGNLGIGILKRFNVTFDYAGKRIVLEKGRSFDEPFEYDMSGIAFDWLEDGTVSVRTVLAGSPAAAAGIEVGDRLLGIGERDLEALGEDGLRTALRSDGAEVTLRLRRGSEVIEKRVRLRRLV